MGFQNMPVCVSQGDVISVATGTHAHLFDHRGKLIKSDEISQEPLPPTEWRDQYGRRWSSVICGCHHHLNAHDDGRCQSGDDDGDGYFDQCYCESFKPGRVGF